MLRADPNNDIWMSPMVFLYSGMLVAMIQGDKPSIFNNHLFIPTPYQQAYSCRGNGLEQPENSSFILFWGSWAPQKDPKTCTRTGKWAEYMSQSLKLEYRPLTKSIGPFLQEKWSKSTRNYFFFMLFWGFWAPPNGPKKVHKGPRVDRMYGLVSQL